LNPLAVGTNITTASGNLNATASSASNAMLQGTFGITSGKWYWEVTMSSGTSFWGGSIIKSTVGLNYSSLSSGDAYSYSDDGKKYNGQTATTYGNTYTTNDLVSVAYNADTGKIWFGKNGTWQASGDPSAGTNEAFSGISGTYMPSALLNNATGIANFGQRPFSYTPPTGYVALNTFNLPASTITNGAGYMAATLYTGTGATQTITTTAQLGSGAMVWTKTRSNAVNWDTRSTGLTNNYSFLQSNTTNAEETTATQYAMTFSNGSYTVGAGDNINQSTRTFVGYQWAAGASASNTSGSITSTTYANTTAGFSVVTYTGTGVTATIGHGLGVAPSMIIVKNRSAVESWRVGHSFMNGGSSPWNYYMNLNATSAQAASSSVWNNTAPTSSVFSISNDSAVSGNGNALVAYCFSAVAGYSAFGSYTGNGSSDGPFVYTGFRPRYILIKSTATANSWRIVDTSRNTYNASNSALWANESTAEGSGSSFDIDILSNGFKVRNATSETNNSGTSMIYAAFAEVPFKSALAR
jgi:hypothetical protein